MNGTLGSNQPGAYNSGSLGAVPVTQPGAYRSGSLGSYKQPGAYNSGSLGFHEPGPVNSGILGTLPSYAAQAGVPQPGAYRSGSLGEYFATNGLGEYFATRGGMQGLGRTGCGCTAQNGLGTTTRFLGRPRRRSMKGLGALGAVSLDLDMMVGIAIGAGVLWAIMGGKCSAAFAG